MRFHVAKVSPRNEAFPKSVTWLVTSALWGIGAAVAVFSEANAAYRAPIVLAFVLVCPGLALVRVLRVPAATAQLSLAIALSVALDVLVPAGLLYAGVWSPSAALVILVAVTVVAATFEVLTAGFRISVGLR